MHKYRKQRLIARVPAFIVTQISPHRFGVRMLIRFAPTEIKMNTLRFDNFPSFVYRLPKL